MSNLEQLAKKLGITIEELKLRIEKNRSAEEDRIESTAKKKRKIRYKFSLSNMFLLDH